VVITQLQASKTEADQRYEAAVKEHAAQLAKAEQRLADASAVILTLQESQRALMQQIADAKVVEKGLRDEMVAVPKAQEANAAADAELASAKATIVQLQTLNKKFAEELKASNEKAKAVAAYEARIVDATQVISALHEQNKRLEAQVADAVAAEKAARDTQAAQEADAKKSLSQYEASAIEAKSVIERLHAANKVLEEKASADARVITQQNEKLSANAKAIDALESRLVAATGIIEELHRKSSTPVVETRQAQAVPIAVTTTASREVVSGSPSDEPPQQDPEIKLLESKLLEATKALSVARNQKKDAEDRLASATAVSATLTATVKQLEKDNDDLKAKTQKLTAAFKELSQRYNQTMTELKASSASGGGAQRSAEHAARAFGEVTSRSCPSRDCQ
jgi:chromosome segregation ATPase